jgi:hypothetical protein
MVHPQREEHRTVKLIAQTPGWSLYDRLVPGEGWINLKLVGSGTLPKRNWWLGFNGTRLLRSRDAGLLEQHQPDIRGSSVRCQDWCNTATLSHDCADARETSMFCTSLILYRFERNSRIQARFSPDGALRGAGTKCWITDR